MERRVHRNAGSNNSCHRNIRFQSEDDVGNSPDLSVEEKACLTFLDETLESIVTEDSALSRDDAQSSGNTISKYHITSGVHQDRSSCNYFPETGSSQDLCAEEKASLKFLEDTINSIVSTDDAESRPEFCNTIGKKHHINEIKNYMDPTPVVLPTSYGIVPTKHKMASPEDYNQLLSDHASHWGPLSSDGLVEVYNSMAMIKTSAEEQPSSYGDQMYSKSCCSKPNPPAVAPKPKKIPSHIAVLKNKETAIPNSDSNPHCLSTSPEKCHLMRPDKAKLKALTKLGLIKKDVIPENEQVLDEPLSSSFPEQAQKKKSGMMLDSSVSDDEQSALQKLSHALSLSLPMASDTEEDQRWALRKLRLLKD